MKLPVVAVHDHSSIERSAILFMVPKKAVCS